MYGLRSKKADMPPSFRRLRRGLLRGGKRSYEGLQILSSLTFGTEHTPRTRSNTLLTNFEFRITCVITERSNLYSYQRWALL